MCRCEKKPPALSPPRSSVHITVLRGLRECVLLFNHGRHRKVEFVQNQSMMIYSVWLIPDCRWSFISVEKILLSVSRFCVFYLSLIHSTVKQFLENYAMLREKKSLCGHMHVEVNLLLSVHLSRSVYI